jgi:ATP-dependent Clp protease ATP-binding subunit ClpC
MLAILNIIVREVKGRLLAHGIGLEISASMWNLISQQGYDRSYGARPLRRAVTQLAEDVIRHQRSSSLWTLQLSPVTR